jgi:hypothetical protein
VEAWGPCACLTGIMSVSALVNHSVQESKMVCLLQQEASWWLVEPGLVSTIYVLEMN